MKKINESLFCISNKHVTALPGLAQVTLMAYPTETPERRRCPLAFLADQYPQILALALQSL